MPELVVCTMPLDDEFLLVGDGDFGGFEDGDFFVGEHCNAGVITCLSD